MSSAAMTYEVSDMVRKQVDSIQHSGPSLGWLTEAPGWARTIVVSAASRVLAWQVNRMGRDIANRAIWFRGAHAQILDMPREAPVDPEFKMVDSLHDTEQRIQRIRQNALDLTQLVIGVQAHDHRAPLPIAASRLSGAAAELYEEVRSLRGAIQAHEASRHVCIGPHATTADEVEAELAKIFAGHD